MQKQSVDAEKDTEQELISQLRKTPAVYMAFTIMKQHIQPYTNLLTINKGKRYKVNDLAKELSISRQAAFKYIKRLKELNAISEIRISNGWYFVVNPKYALRSEDVAQSIVEYFELPISARPTRNDAKGEKDD